MSRPGGAGAVSTPQAVMRAHLALLDDPELAAGAETRIAAGNSAGYAWRGAVHDQIGKTDFTGHRKTSL